MTQDEFDRACQSWASREIERYLNDVDYYQECEHKCDDGGCHDCGLCIGCLERMEQEIHSKCTTKDELIEEYKERGRCDFCIEEHTKDYK